MRAHAFHCIINLCLAAKNQPVRDFAYVTINQRAVSDSAWVTDGVNIRKNPPRRAPRTRVFGMPCFANVPLRCFLTHSSGESVYARHDPPVSWCAKTPMVYEKYSSYSFLSHRNRQATRPQRGHRRTLASSSSSSSPSSLRVRTPITIRS